MNNHHSRRITADDPLGFDIAEREKAEQKALQSSAYSAESDADEMTGLNRYVIYHLCMRVVPVRYRY